MRTVRRRTRKDQQVEAGPSVETAKQLAIPLDDGPGVFVVADRASGPDAHVRHDREHAHRERRRGAGRGAIAQRAMEREREREPLARAGHLPPDVSSCRSTPLALAGPDVLAVLVRLTVSRYNISRDTVVRRHGD